MTNIYILKKGKLLYGPYSLEVVQQKGLKQTDLVWYKGLNDWTAVENIAQLSLYIRQETAKKEKTKTFFEKIFGFLN